ncbi:MAG: A/G-specific adenine glycosylase [Pseudomonadota bacterium]
MTASRADRGEGSAAARLLAWYDRHARRMPWRVGPAEKQAGVRPDPYRVWLSEVMLQQTTVATVTPRFEAFVTRWPRVQALAAAPREEVLAEWAGLGYYARARNLHACALAVAERHSGRFPETEEELRTLPGIGAYTAAAVAAIAFDRPSVVVDGNVERVMARLFAETDPMPGVKSRLAARAATLTPSARRGDYAQAVMDLGATICTPRRPACALCPWRPDCAAHAAGIAEGLPAKAPKKVKPTRHGTVFVVFDPGGRVGTVTRPEKGLLAGMRALPTTDWAEQAPPARPPVGVEGVWQEAGAVTHTFTHFHLTLTVIVSTATTVLAPMPVAEARAAMPTVFVKALDRAVSAHR